MVYLRSTSSAPPKVLYTIFAGRKYHLLFQEPYWLEMYKLGAIHEIHLWDYIPRQEPNGGSTRVYDLNRGYLDSLVKKYEKYDFIKIMDPGDVIMKDTYWYDKDHLEKENNVVEWHDDGSAALRYPEKRSFTEYYKCELRCRSGDLPFSCSVAACIFTVYSILLPLIPLLVVILLLYISSPPRFCCRLHR